MAINIIYAFGNLGLGLYEKSYWFITAGAYYTILSVMRFAAVLFDRKNSISRELFVQKFSGVMLMCLSIVLFGSVYLSVKFDIANEIHEIAMITIATYTFTKLILAIIKAVKVRNKNSPILKALRNISLSDAAVSVFSMQRSMLVSFAGMSGSEIKLMNSLTGTGICLVVLVLGISMIRRNKMAKSKIVKASGKIAEGISGGFKKISDGVVEWYNKIEKGVVKGYTKIEDKFIENYLAKDGETVEEAKKRLEEERK